MNSKIKQFLSLIFMILLMVVTNYFIFKDQSFDTLFQTLQDVNPFYILLGFSMMFVFVSCEAVNSYSIMKALNQKISYLKCLGFAFIGFYFSSITPSSSGGQPAQIFYMSKAKINISYSSLNLLIITVVYQIVMMLYGGILFLVKQQFIMENLHGIKYFLIFSVTINTLITIAILMAMFSKNFIYRIIYYITSVLAKIRLIRNVESVRKKLEAIVLEYTKGAAYIKTQPLLLLRVVLTTTIQMTAMYLVPYFVYKAFQLDTYSMLEIISFQALVSLAVSSIPLPGAVGASENAFMSAFKLFFTSQLLVPAMLLCRGISFYSFLLISGIISLVLHVILTREKSDSNSTPPAQKRVLSS